MKQSLPATLYVPIKHLDDLPWSMRPSPQDQAGEVRPKDDLRSVSVKHEKGSITTSVVKISFQRGHTTTRGGALPKGLGKDKRCGGLWTM